VAGEGSPGIRLSQEQHELKAAVRKFAADRIAPLASDIDRANAWPEHLWQGIRDIGILGVCFDEDLGGGGGTFLDYALMIEELSYASAAVALMPAVNVMAATGLGQFAAAEVAERYVPRIVSGELKACWAFTEPATGSDPKALETRAVDAGDRWVITGRKSFISHSSVAGAAVVFCRTGERISAILVDTDQPGYQPGSRYDLLGLRGADTGDLVLDGVEAPKENVLGEVGDAMRILVSVESESKVRAAAMCVGMARAALDEAISYGNQRLHRGTPISQKYPTIQALLAEISAAVESARWLCYRAATLRDEPDRPAFDRLAATARLVASAAGVRAASLSMQVHGAYGFTADYPISRIYRDVKAYEMIQGTSEIQRTIIGKSLIGSGPSARAD
jgi:alkylation response protein AidB-like acyl-CoA dehydrogenase